MRRYFLYLTVALVAFSIGSFLSVRIYQNISEQPIVSVLNETPVEENHPSIPQDENFSSDEHFNELVVNSFKPVIDKWRMNHRVKEYVELERNDDWASFTYRRARTALIDINGDGTKELAIQTGCTAAGNCDFYLFKKTKSGYEQMLTAYMVQQFRLRKSKTNGYFDLETSARGNATDGELRRYKFNGKEYITDKCFYYEYKTFRRAKNQFVTADRPTLTAIPCVE